MLIVDPRPDLQEDTRFWNRILPRAIDINREAAEVLHGLRCLGATLQLTQAGYKLIPGIGPGYLYEKHEDWIADREKYLLPIQSDLQRILSR